MSKFQEGNQLVRSGKLEEAVTAYQESIQQNPQFHWSYQNLGETLWKLGRLDEAAEVFRQAISVNSSAVWCLLRLEELLHHQERHEEAAIELKKVTDLYPDSTEALQKLKDTLQKDNRKIVVYTCNFNNYESIKEPLAIDPRAEYILFTDQEGIKSKSWKVIQIHELSENPRRASRLAKILPHKYLPPHDISVYIDSSFILREKDIYTMVQRCMEGCDIALYKHSERDCVYDEIDFCEKSELRSVEPKICLKIREKYKSINYPRKNGLFENGFIFRKNNSKINTLNELWWCEYSASPERDQFTLMYCLSLLNIEPNPIKIGEQIRKNPFVKWVKHEYKSYSRQASYRDDIDSCYLYIVYMDKFHDWGTTRLRGQQIFERLKSEFNIKMIPYSKAVYLYNKHMLFLKIHNYDVLTPIIENNNRVYLDMVDCNSKYINLKKHILKGVEFGIFTTKSCMEFYKSLFKYPEKCKTIYHHWDVTLGKFKSEPIDSVRVAYFGVIPKCFLYKQVPEIDFYEVTSTNFNDALKRTMSRYNVHYIVRPLEEQKEFPALTKLSTASVFQAPVISSKTSEVELLGDDYPYYIEDLNIQSVLKTIEKVKVTFQKDEWYHAVDVMKSIKDKTSIDSVVREYTNLFHSMGEIPSLYTYAKDKKKAIYTANIGSYDESFPINSDFSDGWDAYYFSDNPNFECPGWTHVYVDTEKVKRHSKVAYAREIKTRPHLYLPDYDVTLWIDSSFNVKRSLNESLRNFPNDDFIATRHHKRKCIYEEIQQPRVISKVGQPVLEQVKLKFETEGVPKNFGLQETGFLLRKNTEKCRKINESWWNYMEQYHVYRDQIWLSYVLFKMGSDITCVDRTVRNRCFDIAEHSNLVTTKKKYALDFDPINHAYVEILYQKGLTLADDLTIEFWIKIREWPDTWTNIISKQLNDFENEFCFRMKNERLGQFYYGSGGEVVVLDWMPKSTLALNSWTYVTCVRKIGEFQKLYFNGALIQETACAEGGEAAKTEAPILLMTDIQRSRFANAQMCDLRIWRRVLDDREIMHGMNQELQGNEDGLVEYWKFDSGTGTQLIGSNSCYSGLIYRARWKSLIST